MSTAAPISITTSGLVFHYDIDNIKSYAGPNIKNETTAITAYSHGSGTGYSFVTGTETSYIPALNATVTNAYSDIQNTGASWCCPNPYTFGTGVSISGSTLYTYAIVYKCNSGYTNGNYMYRYEYNSGGTYLTENGVFDNSRRVDLGNGWYWAWGTFTSQATAATVNLYAFYYQYSSYSDRLSIAMAGLFKGDYTNLNPRYWPSIGVTRTNTQTLTDLTGNNTWTVNNLTYDYSSFTFNGSNSWIESSTSTVFDSNTITMESWCNPTTTAQSGFLFEKGQVNTQYSNFFDAGGGFYFRTIGGTITNQDSSFAASTYITANKWNHIVCTYNGSIKIIYVNGVQIASVAASGTLASGQTNQYVGKYGNVGNNYQFNGKIGISRVYNRALSASEVLQNYNSAKSRFSL